MIFIEIFKCCHIYHFVKSHPNPPFWVYKMYPRFCLHWKFHWYRFWSVRQIDYIYNSSPCEVSVLYNNALLHGLMYRFMDLYMYVNIYGWDRRCCDVNIWLYIFGDKLFFMTLLILFFPPPRFHFEVACSLHALHLCWRGKWRQFENLWYIICYLNRNNCVVKTIIIVCLLLQKWMATSWTPLTTIFLAPFFRCLFNLWYFTPSQFATG